MNDSSDFEELLLDDLAFTALPVENCTRLFGNRSAAGAFNVTCLDHAPTLTRQVCT